MRIVTTVALLLTLNIQVNPQRVSAEGKSRLLNYDILYCISDSVLGYDDPYDKTLVVTFKDGDIISLAGEIWQSSMDWIQLKYLKTDGSSQIISIPSANRSDFIYLMNYDIDWLRNFRNNHGNTIESIAHGQLTETQFPDEDAPVSVKIFRDHPSHKRWRDFSDNLNSIQTLVIEQDLLRSYENSDETRVLMLLDLLIRDYPRENVILPNDIKGMARTVAKTFKTNILLSQGDRLVELGDYSNASDKYNEAFRTDTDKMDIYFSIGGVINHDYIRGRHELNKLKYSLRSKPSEKKTDSYNKISINPDYHFDRYTVIQRGLEVSKLSKDGFENLGKVENFIYTITEFGGGGLFFEYSKDNIIQNNEYGGLYLLSNRLLSDVTISSSSLIAKPEVSKKIQADLISYFNTNRDIADYHIYDGRSRISLDLPAHEYQDTLKTIMNLKIWECSPGGDLSHLVEGSFTKYGGSFICLYNEKRQLTIKKYTRMGFMFSIEQKSYLLLNSGQRGTGINVQTIYEIRDGGLHQVFSEGFWST